MTYSYNYFNYTISGASLPVDGIYTLIVNCLGSTENGYSSFALEVSDWDYKTVTPRGEIINLSIFLIIGGIVVFFLYMWHKSPIGWMRTSHFVLAYLFSFVGVFFITEVARNQGLPGNITQLLDYLLWIYGIIFIFVLFAVVYGLILRAVQRKSMENGDIYK